MNFGGSKSSQHLRNIALRVQLKADEGDVVDLPLIYGQSSNQKAEFEATTSITHHSKQPKFYEEFKIEIPGNLTKFHFLYFTFTHVSFIGKSGGGGGSEKSSGSHQSSPYSYTSSSSSSSSTLDVDGWTWLPLTVDDRLNSGVQELPVVVDPPPTSFSVLTTSSADFSRFNCVEKHKPVFKVEVDVVSSVHSLDDVLEKFTALTRSLEKGELPSNIESTEVDDEFRFDTS